MEKMLSINKRSYILFYVLILNNWKNQAKRWKNTEFIDLII